MNISNIKSIINTLAAGCGLSVGYCEADIQHHLYILSIGPNQYSLNSETSLSEFPTVKLYTHKEIMGLISSLDSQEIQYMALFNTTGSRICAWKEGSHTNGNDKPQNLCGIQGEKAGQ